VRVGHCKKYCPGFKVFLFAFFSRAGLVVLATVTLITARRHVQEHNTDKMKTERAAIKDSPKKKDG
jgi:hypothetical protein